MVREHLKLNKFEIFTFLTKIIPESKFKDRLNYFIYDLADHPFYQAEKLISNIRTCKDGILYLETNDGLAFYGLPDKNPYAYLKYLNRSKVNKIKDYPFFGSFFMILDEIFNKNIYGKFIHINKGDIVVDAGAHFGLFTVMASKIVGDEGKVIAIEPEPENLKILKKNIKLNNLKNVITINKGIWSSKKDLKMNKGQYNRSHTFVEDHPEKTSEGLVLQVDTLDDILKELNIKTVDFIKMDIEGSEVEALDGMGEVFKFKPNMVIAAYHQFRGKETYHDVVKKLKDNNFQLRTLKGHKMVYAADVFYGQHVEMVA
jgi:FkbM family methyltransferase